ncbi:MAG: transposase [Candidatus Hodarchaeales archaeon]
MKSIRSTTTVSLDLLKACVVQMNLRQWLPRRKSRLGRPSYEPLALFLALLVKIRENIPYDTVLARKIEENDTYRMFYGFNKRRTPSHDTLSRLSRKLTERRLQTIIKNIDHELATLGAFDKDELSIDAIDILSNGRNKHNLDPEAGSGYKTDKERFHGYWAVSVAGTKSEMVRALRVTPADVHQSKTAQRLFDDLKLRDLSGATLFMADSAYDDKKTYHRCVELGLVSLIAYNPRRSKIKNFERLKDSNWRKRCLGTEGTILYKKYYSGRSVVERYQSTLKEILNGRSLPIRGLVRVTRHLLLTCILGQLFGLVNYALQNSKPRYTLLPLDHYFS